MLREAKPQVESLGRFDWKVIGGRSNVIRGTRNSWHLENTDSNLSGKILFVGLFFTAHTRTVSLFFCRL